MRQGALIVKARSTRSRSAFGFFYYSGHGAAEKDTNINYLIPIHARDPGTTTFWDDSVKLDDIMRLLDGARGALKFVVFDACRNEPQLPTRDTSKGLVPVPEQQATSGDQSTTTHFARRSSLWSVAAHRLAPGSSLSIQTTMPLRSRRERSRPASARSTRE
jgi:Caspase domain